MACERHPIVMHRSRQNLDPKQQRVPRPGGVSGVSGRHQHGPKTKPSKYRPVILQQCFMGGSRERYYKETTGNRSNRGPTFPGLPYN